MIRQCGGGPPPLSGDCSIGAPAEIPIASAIRRERSDTCWPARQVPLVNRLDLLEVTLEGSIERLGQHGEPVFRAFPIADRDLFAGKINVLYPQPQVSRLQGGQIYFQSQIRILRPENKSAPVIPSKRAHGHAPLRRMNRWNKNVGG